MGKGSKTRENAEQSANNVDLYATLDVARDVSPEDLKREYRKLALRFHPDKNPGDEVAQNRFQEISRAYSILSDPKKRKYYDETGSIEDVDITPEDFLQSFQCTMQELMDGESFKELFQGMTAEDIAELPPFPFPKELFPPGTFPAGLRFSSEGLQGMPPAVEELLESGDPEALANMMAGASFGWDFSNFTDSDSEPAHPRSSQPSKRKQRGSGAKKRGKPKKAATKMKAAASQESNSRRASLHTDNTMDPAIMELESLMSQADGKISRADFNRVVQLLGEMGQLPDGFPGDLLDVESDSSSDAPESCSYSTKTEFGKSFRGGNFDESWYRDESTTPEKAERPDMPSVSSPSCQASRGSLEQFGQYGKAKGLVHPDGTETPTPSMIRDWMEAAKTGSIRRMAHLLSRSATLLNCNAGGVGHTALHWAAAKGCEDSLWWLLENGADVCSLNTELSTPLHAAARNGQMICVELLLTQPGIQPELRDEEGLTAAELAAGHGHDEVANIISSAFLQRGSSENCQPPNSSPVRSQGNSKSSMSLFETPTTQGGRTLTPSPLAPASPLSFAEARAEVTATTSCNGHMLHYRQDLFHTGPAPGARQSTGSIAAQQNTTDNTANALNGSCSAVGSLVLPPGETTANLSKGMVLTQVQLTDQLCKDPTVINAALHIHSSKGVENSTEGCSAPQPEQFPLSLATGDVPINNTANAYAALPAGVLQGRCTALSDSDADEPLASVRLHMEPKFEDKSSLRASNNVPAGGHLKRSELCTSIPSSSQVPQQERQTQQHFSPKQAQSLPQQPQQKQQQQQQQQQRLQQGKPSQPTMQPPAVGAQSSKHPARKSMTPEEKAALRQKLLDEAAKADAAEQDEAGPSCSTSSKRPAPVAAAAAVGVRLDEGREWMEAAKQGKLIVLQDLLKLNPALLHYRGQGTKFSFSGHAALHWAAAKGHLAVLRWLLRQGAHPDLRNFAGSTPLHAAVSNRQVQCCRVLLLEGRAEGHVADDLGETPKDVALRLQQPQLAKDIDVWARVSALRRVDKAQWPLRSIRGFLVASGVDMSGVLEKQELLSLCGTTLSKFPSHIVPIRVWPVLDVSGGPIMKGQESAESLPASSAPTVNADAVTMDGSDTVRNEELTEQQAGKPDVQEDGVDDEDAAARYRILPKSLKPEAQVLQSPSSQNDATTADMNAADRNRYSSMQNTPGSLKVSASPNALAPGIKAPLKADKSSAESGRNQTPSKLPGQKHTRSVQEQGTPAAQDSPAHSQPTSTLQESKNKNKTLSDFSDKEAVRNRSGSDNMMSGADQTKPGISASPTKKAVRFENQSSSADDRCNSAGSDQCFHSFKQYQGYEVNHDEGAKHHQVHQHGINSGSDSEDDDGDDAGRSQQLSQQAQQRGNAAFGAKDYVRALTQYSLAVRLDPKNAKLHSNRSAALAALGRYEQALEAADKVVQLDTKWPKGHCRRGTALLGMDQAGEAVKAFKKALALDSKYEAAVRGMQEAREHIRNHRQRYEAMWGAHPSEQTV